MTESHPSCRQCGRKRYAYGLCHRCFARAGLGLKPVEGMGGHLPESAYVVGEVGPELFRVDL